VAIHAMHVATDLLPQMSHPGGHVDVSATPARGTNHTNPSSSPILHSRIRSTTTRLRPPQKCTGSAQPPEDWCCPICGQHEIN